MNRRDLIRMSDEEIRAFLQEQRTLQIATIDHDGWPHLVAMWYVMINGQIVFWTYAKSQKAVNLRRDPRLTCLVEAGTSYEKLRGVQIKGHAIISDDHATVLKLGEAIYKATGAAPGAEGATATDARAAGTAPADAGAAGGSKKGPDDVIDAEYEVK